MPQVKEITVYKLNELPEKVQEKVIANFRNNDSYPWADEARASLAAFEQNFPVKIGDYEYGYRNFIESDVNDPQNAELSGVRLYKFLINNRYDRVKTFRRRDPETNHKIWEIVSIWESCPMTGYCCDDDLLEPIRAFLKYPQKNKTLAQLMQDCADAWLKAVDDDYQHWLSEGSIKEDIEANDYNFTIEGEIYNG